MLIERFIIYTNARWEKSTNFPGQVFWFTLAWGGSTVYWARRWVREMRD